MERVRSHIIPINRRGFLIGLGISVAQVACGVLTDSSVYPVVPTPAATSIPDVTTTSSKQDLTPIPTVATEQARPFPVPVIYQNSNFQIKVSFPDHRGDLSISYNSKPLS